MKKIYFVHTASKGLTGRLIRFFTSRKGHKATRSHTMAIYFSQDMNCWATLEALGDGIFPRALSKRISYIKENAVSVHEYNVSDEVMHNVLVRASGLHYDYMLNLGWIMPGLGNKLFNADKYVPAFNSRSKFNCSELFASEFAYAGIPGFIALMFPERFATALDSVSGCCQRTVEEMLRVICETEEDAA